jgi:anti-sigma B factor antagonist
MSAPALKHLKLEEVDGVAIVDFVNAELMYETALVHDIGEELKSLLSADKQTRILLDFDRVQYLSSTMLGLLAKLARTVESSGGQLKLTGLGPVLRDTLRIGHFEPLFEIYDTRASALKAFRR